MSKLTYTGSNTITYSGVFANTDLVYVLDNYALKEYIVLKDNSAPNKFTFRYSMNGLTMKNLDGKTFFVDDSGTAVFALDTLFAVDANDVMTEALTYDFTPVKGSTDVNVTITLDPNYLSAKDRAFPVVIDPTKILIKSVNTADACVCSGYPSTNYQTAYQLRTGYDTDYGKRRTYIRFDIPTSVPAGGVTNSILYLKKLSGAAPSIRAYRCTGSWSSATITWNNMPGYTDTGASELGEPWVHDNIWQKMIVTSIVQGWVNGTYSNYGFVVKDITEMNPNIWTTFYSSDAEADHRPELRIDYIIPPSVTLYLHYNTAYMDAHSDAYSRILSNAQAIKDIYDARFGIKVNIVNPTSYTCYADANCTWHADSSCQHTSDIYCENSTLNESGTPTLKSLHHTNIHNIALRIPMPSINSVRMVYIGQDTCEVDTEIVGYHYENPYRGLAYPSRRIITITDKNDSTTEFITALHEFGHMFGVKDHYGNGCPSTEDMRDDDEDYSRDCIYGEDRKDNDVVTGRTICGGCQNLINANKNLYS